MIKAGSHKFGAQTCCKFHFTNVYMCPGGCTSCRAGYTLDSNN